MKRIYIFKSFSKWASRSYETTPVYITDDFEDGLAQIKEHRGCTEEQAKELRECIIDGSFITTKTFNDNDEGWIVEDPIVGTFID